MKDRIVLLVVIVQQRFITRWQRMVAYINPRLIAFWQKLVRRYESLASRFAEQSEVPTPAPVVPDHVVRVGDVAINPRWTWIKVKNPKGRRNGNGFHDFGDSAGIKEGGRLTVVAIDGDQVLVSYESPRPNPCGSEAGNGTLFFVPKGPFVRMTEEWHLAHVSKADEKARIMGLLRRTLTEAESS